MDLLSDFNASDPVSAALRTVKVRSTIYCRSVIGAPWGFGVMARGHPAFHVVTDGACWLEVDGEPDQIPLAAGDLVVLPTGAPALDARRSRHPGDGARGDPRHHAARRAPPAPLRWPRVSHRTTLRRVHARRRRRPPDPPRPPGDGAHPRCQRAPGPMAGRHPRAAARRNGVGCPRRGGDRQPPGGCSAGPGAAHRLTELRSSDGAGVLALRDPRIAAAIELIHRRPDNAWTVGELVAEVALSRSAFSARFRQLVGEAPKRRITAPGSHTPPPSCTRSTPRSRRSPSRSATAPSSPSPRPSSAPSASPPAPTASSSMRSPGGLLSMSKTYTGGIAASWRDDGSRCAPDGSYRPAGGGWRLRGRRVAAEAAARRSASVLTAASEVATVCSQRRPTNWLHHWPRRHRSAAISPW
jgi:AraC-like DNA-binding protein